MDRRRYLEASCGLLSVASAGLAGCLGGDNTDETDETESAERNTDGGFETPFEGAYETVAKWLPAPAVLDTDPYRVNSMAPAELAAMADHLPDGALESIAELVDGVAIDTLELSDIDRLVVARYGDVLSPTASSSLVLEGAIDPAAVGPILEEDGYEHVRSDDGYDYYDAEQDAYAVAADTLVMGRGRETLEIVERIVDVEAGRTQRYTAENEAFERFVDAFSPGHLSFAGPTDPDNAEQPFGTMVADGVVMQVQGETTLTESVMVLEDGTTVDESDVETELGSHTTSEVDGSIVRIHNTQPTADVNF